MFREFTIPTPNSGPYGIALDSKGRVWLSEFNTNKFARFDPGTEKFEEYEMPSRDTGCRTLVLDAQGNVWCPGSGVNKLVRLTP
jgi:virginiamycin B lyase